MQWGQNARPRFADNGGWASLRPQGSGGGSLDAMTQPPQQASQWAPATFPGQQPPSQQQLLQQQAPPPQQAMGQAQSGANGMPSGLSDDQQAEYQYMNAAPQQYAPATFPGQAPAAPQSQNPYAQAAGRAPTGAAQTFRSMQRPARGY